MCSKKKAEDLKRIRTKIEGAFIVKAGVEHVSGDPPIEESIANEQRHDDTLAATEHVSVDSLIDEANSPIDESIANEQQQPQDDTFVVEAAIEHVSGDAPIDESIVNDQRQDDTFVVEAAIEHVFGDAPIDESIANEQQQRQDDPSVEAATEQSGDAPIDESIANEQLQRLDDTFVVEVAIEHVSGDAPINESIANEQQQRQDNTFAATEHVSMDSLIDEANSPIDESIANEQQQPQDDTFVVEEAIEHVSGDAPIDESIVNDQRQDDTFVGEAATERDSFANEQRQDDTVVVEPATEHVSVDSLIDETNPPIDDEIGREQNATYILETATTCAHNLTKKRSPISTDTDYGLDDFTSGDDTDPEDEPRKQIPHWAEGKSLERHIIKIRGILSTMNIERYFGRIKQPDAQDLFKSFNRLYPRRRPSTANWNSPMSNPTPGVGKHFSMSK